MFIQVAFFSFAIPLALGQATQVLSSREICNLSADDGPCLAYIKRWFYNKYSGKCESFIYGGCQGNANNFETKGECERLCTSNNYVCNFPAERGPCQNYVVRWFYDKSLKRCEPFVYGGCQDNGNNFFTKFNCEEVCVNANDVCRMPSDPGPCRSRMVRWFFNTATKRCEAFIYGGCGGNSNNFQSAHACQTKCSQIPMPL